MRSTNASGKSAVLLLLLFVVMLGSGCATYGNRATRIRQAFYKGDLPRAGVLVEEAATKERRARDMFKLDQAIIMLAQGDPKGAEIKLREVRNRFDENEGQGWGETTAAYLSDDNALEYEGEDYEKVLVRAFLALSNLFQDGTDTEAYCLQMIEKQNEIMEDGEGEYGENPKLNYRMVALAPYLRGVLKEASHRFYDDVERSYVEVCSWQPEFVNGPIDLQRARTGVHSQKGNGVLYVFTLVGKGPIKIPTVEEPTSDALQAATVILGMTGNTTLPFMSAPVEVPQVIGQPNQIAGVGVAVNGRPIGMTQTITDVTQLAMDQYGAVYHRVVGRAIARRAVKRGINFGAKEVFSEKKNFGTNLLFDVAELVWESIESADTRSWQLLPDKIQVIRIELPAGVHEITLDPAGYDGTVIGPSTTRRVLIEDGRNTYMLGNFPEPELLGELLIRTP